MYKNDRETLKYKLGLQNDIEKMWDITSIPVVTSAFSWCSHEKNGKHIYLASKMGTSGGKRWCCILPWRYVPNRKIKGLYEPPSRKCGITVAITCIQRMSKILLNGQVNQGVNTEKNYSPADSNKTIIAHARIHDFKSATTSVDHLTLLLLWEAARYL